MSNYSSRQKNNDALHACEFLKVQKFDDLKKSKTRYEYLSNKINNCIIFLHVTKIFEDLWFHGACENIEATTEALLEEGGGGGDGLKIYYYLYENFLFRRQKQK